MVDGKSQPAARSVLQKKRQRARSVFSAMIDSLGGFRCLRCGKTDTLQNDHIVPKKNGGPNEPWNLQPLCKMCNQLKGARYSGDYRPEPYKAQLMAIARDVFDARR